MKSISSYLMLSLLVLGAACAQGEDGKAKAKSGAASTSAAKSAEVPALPLDKDSAGKDRLFDYNIPLDGISDPGILLSHFTSRPLLVFYYSPKCPHCQSTFPQFQAMVNEFAGQGVAGIAISVRDVRKNDIRMFMDQQNVTIPMLQDTHRKFSELYGTGYVPLMMLVQPDGRFLRFTSNNDNVLATIRAELVRRVQP